MLLVKALIVAALTYWLHTFLTLNQGPTLAYWALSFPGTFLHEAAHWLAALFTDGRPAAFSVFPEWDSAGRMVTMGHVIAHYNWYNSALIGLAPLMLAPLTALFILAAVNSTMLKAPLWVYLAVCSWSSCIPSSQDVSIALAMPSSWPLAFFVILASCWLTYMVVSRFTIRSFEGTIIPSKGVK